jgi:NADH-quinone oxidoreductase subunit L
MKVVAIVGALTAIFAASIGLVQNDIKRVLAYSTVSQLGYMFLALGVGAFSRRSLSRLHACVLQGAAVPRLGLGHPRHERRAGYARHGRPARKDSHTYRTMFIGTLAIAGIPGLRASSPKMKFSGRPGRPQGGASAPCGTSASSPR